MENRREFIKIMLPIWESFATISEIEFWKELVEPCIY